MKKNAVLFCALALICALQSSSYAFTINLKPKKDSPYSFQNNILTEMNMSMMGTDMQMNMDMKFDLLITANKIDKDSLNFTVVTKNIKAKVSTIPETKIPKTLDKELDKFEASQEITINNNGKIIRVGATKGLEEFTQKLSQMGMSNFTSSIGEASSYIMPIYNRDFKIGDTCVADFSKKSENSELEMKNSYQFMGEIDTLGFKCAKFAVKSLVGTVKQTVKQGDMSLKINVNLETTGLLLLNENDGLTVLQKNNSKMTMTVDADGNKEIESMMNDIKATVTTETIRKK